MCVGLHTVIESPRIGPGATGFRVVLALLLLSSHPVGALAQQRFHRLFTAEDGLNPPAVASLAQDSSGFLWIGTEGGLFRYDGVEMWRWAPETLDRRVVSLDVSPHGQVIALQEGGTLFAIAGNRALPLAGPDRAPLRVVRDATFDARGDLWIVRDDEVWSRGRDGWLRADLPGHDGERPLRVRPRFPGGAHVATTGGMWRLDRDRAPERILDGFLDLVEMRSLPDGRLLVVTWLGKVLEITDAGTREIFDAIEIGAGGRAIDLVERNGILWLGVDRYLVGWGPGRKPLILDENDGVLSGGPLLVDREGSLWMGSFVGLYQFPEPDTEIWTQRAGLPSNHVRYVARGAGAIWLTTWQGAAVLRDDGGRGVELLSGWMPSPPCSDSGGVVWAGSTDGLLRIARPGSAERALPGPISMYGCHSARDSSVWLATDRGLYRVPVPGEAPELVPTSFAGTPASIESVLVDSKGTVWVSSGEAICSAPAREVVGPAEVPWTCDSIPGAVHVSGGGIVETAWGEIWVSSNRLGVVRRTADGWAPLPRLDRFPSRSILSLRRSRMGGVWVVGHGVIDRVVPSLTDAAGWRTAERLSHWHGLPGVSGTTLLEERDGSLWVTTSQGLAHVPAASRFTEIAPPDVVLVDARVDGEPVPTEPGLELPHDRNRLQLRFAALSFRDPALLRYEVRLSPEQPWRTTAGEPSFLWADLPAGHYHPEVRASLDGRTWSAQAATFAFRVARPWYRTWWALTLFSLIVLAVVYSAYQLRLAHLLDLERQRTRIAMDLHDEIGSGLGSIGILSGLLRDDGVERAEQRRMASEIATTSRELGTALSQIVWSLSARTSTLESLAGRITELGRRLFAGDAVDFALLFPARWPAVRLSPLVRRNALLIALEALHNAARHARARRVEISLEPSGDGRWDLTIADDGIGLDVEKSGGGTGVGRRSMRLRAEEIGAELDCASADGAGTRVRLRFSPLGDAARGPGRMIMRWGDIRRRFRIGA